MSQQTDLADALAAQQRALEFGTSRDVIRAMERVIRVCRRDRVIVNFPDRPRRSDTTPPELPPAA